MKKLLTRYGFISLIVILLNQTWFVSIVKADSFDANQLASLELDELLAADVQVTSAMKRLQNMSDSAASIYVLSNKEIMRSGVTTVPDALKLVPGMQIRQVDNNQWAITLRSTAGRYSSKLLVMIDGQSIYNPGFAGVYWEALNIPLYDIERIEVIRGQGGLLWGSNATNGVVNIISKHTADTHSAFVQLEKGSVVEGKANFRVGGALANYSSFRLFGGVERSEESSANQISLAPSDDGKKQTVGGRVDLNFNDDTSLLLQTQYTHINMGQNLKLSNLVSYEDEYLEDQYTRDHLQLMARFEQRLSADSNQMLQASISSQKGEQLFYKDDFFITDIDYQMNTLVNDVQLDWGGNYRYNNISVSDTDYISSLTEVDSYHQFGGFLQAQFNLIPETLKLIIGNKTEKNSFTGWEHQPMARLSWRLDENHFFWGAVSQGVRIPSLFEYNGNALAKGIRLMDGYPLFKADVVGSSELEAETSLSKELGYRYQVKNWDLDFSLFHTKSKNVLAIKSDFDVSTNILHHNFVANAELITFGGEAVIKWQPFAGFTTELGYSLTSYEYHLPEKTREAIGYDAYLRQFISKANYEISKNHSVFAVYRIENGEAYGTDGFSVLDLNWNWQLSPITSLSFSGMNLLYGRHLEYNNTSETYTVATYIEPSYLVRLTMKL
mgnify:CR=1 FL=1|tara:strand:- start:52003 stop:54003 length:2001 start_codon:yes stop_codon:yes gene_type:complete